MLQDSTLTQEIMVRLDALAASLGVAAGELWRVLMVQARVEVVQTLYVASVGVALMLVGKYLFGRSLKANDSKDEASWFTGAVLVSLLGVVLFIGGVGTSITPALNPEYWALKEILKALP